VTLAFSDVGNGPAIVFAHGIATDRTRWRPLVERLSPEFRCVSVDLPGHGESADDGCDGVSAASAIHDLVRHLSLAKPTIVGHSLGGTVALLYGALFAPRAVVAIDPVGLYLPHLAARLSPYVARMQTDDFPAAFLEWEEQLLDSVPEPQRTALADSMHPRAEVVLSYWSSLLRPEDAATTQTQFSAALAAITAPTLVCLADPPTPEDAAVLDELPSATVEIYEGMTHFMHVLDPDRFAQRIRAWMSDAPA
jgi:pimeloyl-ACP methyl ester carboxylesterase